MDDKINNRQAANLELIKSLNIGVYRAPTISPDGKITLIVPGLFARLPCFLDALLMLPLILIAVVTWQLFTNISSEEIAGSITAILWISGLILYYKLRKQIISKRYNLLSDGDIYISKDTLHIPSIYTKTNQGVDVSQEEIEKIDFNWNHSLNRAGLFSSNAIDLIDTEITLKNGHTYLLPVWITKTKDLLYGLQFLGYPVFLVRTDRQLFKWLYNMLLFSSIAMLIVGVSIAIIKEI